MLRKYLKLKPKSTEKSLPHLEEDDEIEERDADEAAERVHKEWTEFFTAKAEDMAYVISEPDLKKLCLRVNCRVNMSRWNMVADIKCGLGKQGRLEGKSAANIDKFLTKAVNRYKARQGFYYTDEQIATERYEDFCDLKRFNILRLQLWEREEQAAKASANEVANKVEDDFALHSDSDDTVADSVDAVSGTLEGSVSDDEELMLTPLESGPHVANNVEIDSTPENSGYRIVTRSKTVNNSGINLDMMGDFAEVNTESLNFGSQASNVMLLPLQSEELVAGYDEFNMRIPLTSTQTQSQEIV